MVGAGRTARWSSPWASARSPRRRTAETLRRAAGAAVRALAGTRRVTLALPAPTRTCGASRTGALLGAYAFAGYRVASASEQKSPVDRVILLVDDPKDADAARPRARVRTVAAAVNLTRDLVNTPPSDLSPPGFADAAAGRGRLAVDVEVLDEKALRRRRLRRHRRCRPGSANPPRLIRLAYRPDGRGRHVAFVGKGITFDSGGISIKPAREHGGDEVRHGRRGGRARRDRARSRGSGCPVAVTAYVAGAENMPSGTA